MTKTDKIIAIDVETTGFNRGDNITLNHQILSIGLIVATGDFEPIDKFYAEIKWNGQSRWSSAAEKIHGLSREYLDENGMDEEEAVVAIAEFILKHYEPDEAIIFLGHNPRNFDIPFFNKLMHKYGVDFRVAHRAIDSFSTGYVCLGAKDSDELFGIFYPKRGTHNSLDDASMALGICRKIRKIFDGI